MSVLEFVDSNLLVYAHDADAGNKRLASANLLARLWEQGGGCLSIQVLAEFYATVTRKLTMPASAAENIVIDLAGWTIHRPGFDDVISASRLHRRHRLPWWDALILQSALVLGCSTLWTEDFSHGQRFGALTIRNPFR